MDIYNGSFSSWRDVAEHFRPEGLSRWDAKDSEAIMEACPEPDRVLLAVYDIYGYEGSALVVFQNGDKFYVNEGGHCSCNGLEGQWEPDEYTLEELIYAVERWDAGYGIKAKYWSELSALLVGLRSGAESEPEVSPYMASAFA